MPDKNIITPKQIESLVNNSKIDISLIGDKTTLVVLTLPNGFVITETSSCVYPDNYNEEIGKDICMVKIMDKLWYLEDYRLQCKMDK